MTDWTAGYVADIGYTYGYYTELNPLRTRFAFLHAGLVPPETATVCELGFGQGLSANIHAAAQSGGQLWATDFNPAQAGFAQSLAAACGSGARLFDQSFAEFCQRDDLPEFDSIGLHGIWSWISDDNRAAIVDFVRRRLRVGGVLYISYNTLPGWAAFAPLRHLMTQHAEVIGAAGHGIVQRVEGALSFTQQLLDLNPLYARANPQVIERIKKIKEQNRHYLAHEYFNRDWMPMHVATLADWLAPAKVSFACSAHPIDQIDPVNLTADQRGFLRAIPDPLFRESVRDFMVNQQFRRDYWVRGARRLSPLEQTEALRAERMILTTYRPDVPLKATGALGEIGLNEQIYAPILDCLADHKPKTLGQIEQAVKTQGIQLAQVVEAALILTGAGHLAAAQDEMVIGRAKKHTDRLNGHLIQKARASGDIGFLASPVTGSGIAVGRFQQLFLLARSQGQKQPADWASFVWQLLSAQGQRIIKDGRTLETAEEHLDELAAQARTFAETRLPVLKALQVA